MYKIFSDTLKKMLIDNLFVVVIIRNSLLQLRLIVAFDRDYIKPNNITDLEPFLLQQEIDRKYKQKKINRIWFWTQ